MKTTITQVAVHGDGDNPAFHGFVISMDSEGDGTYLTIRGEDEVNSGSMLKFDWDEWDDVVKAVAQYRKEWEAIG